METRLIRKFQQRKSSKTELLVQGLAQLQWGQSCRVACQALVASPLYLTAASSAHTALGEAPAPGMHQHRHSALSLSAKLLATLVAPSFRLATTCAHPATQMPRSTTSKLIAAASWSPREVPATKPKFEPAA